MSPHLAADGLQALGQVFSERGFEPVEVGQFEITEGAAELGRLALSGPALVLVRLHTRPIGLVLATGGSASVTPDEWLDVLHAALGERVSDHLLTFGCGAKEHPGGRPGPHAPSCLARRRRILERARPLSVIVATRNRPTTLARCLDSLFELDYPNFEVVVVDNDPTDDSARDLVHRYHPGGKALSYVREPQRGLAAAHNRGLSVAQGEVVAFTDDDVRVDTHWLSAIAEGMSCTPGVACVTGLIVPAALETAPQLMLECHGSFSKGLSRRIVGIGLEPPDDAMFPFDVGRLGSGANMAFDARALTDMGGFDSALGVGTPARGGDDLAAFHRVLTLGWRLVYEPSAIVWHQHRRNLSALRRQVHGYGVGLGAYLASAVAHDPRDALSILSKMPSAARYIFSTQSPRRRSRPADWPASLATLELGGMALGPLAYVRSRRRSQWGKETSAGHAAVKQ